MDERVTIRIDHNKVTEIMAKAGTTNKSEAMRRVIEHYVATEQPRQPDSWKLKLLSFFSKRVLGI